jgi:putative component of membrane protein insertase Oxa1/YidC/SpoIIIJ protein YidD
MHRIIGLSLSVLHNIISNEKGDRMNIMKITAVAFSLMIISSCMTKPTCSERHQAGESLLEEADYQGIGSE